MNTDSTKHGAFEQSSPTRNWLVKTERESKLTYGIAIGGAIFAMAVWGVATYGEVHPLLAALAAYFGVK